MDEICHTRMSHVTCHVLTRNVTYQYILSIRIHHTCGAVKTSRSVNIRLRLQSRTKNIGTIAVGQIGVGASMKQHFDSCRLVVLGSPHEWCKRAAHCSMVASAVHCSMVASRHQEDARGSRRYARCTESASWVSDISANLNTHVVTLLLPKDPKKKKRNPP